MQIQDLSKELAAEEMSAVHGGTGDRANANVGNIVQGLVVNAPNTVGAGAGSSVNSDNEIDVTQYATQHVHQNNGDSLFVAFPFIRPLR
jgi:hypothetical protein